LVLGRTSAKMDSHPLVRRPHKSPAHTVKDRRNRPQRLIPMPLSFVAKAPEGAAHYRVVSVSVNTLVRFFSCLPARVGTTRRSHIMGGFDKLVKTSFLLRPAFFRFVKTPLVGPRIIGEHLNPSTPQRTCFFPCRVSFPRPLQGRALCTAAIDLGRGCEQLDERSRLRNREVRSLEPNLCALSPYSS
jgi:hypothetical protein